MRQALLKGLMLVLALALPAAAALAQNVVPPDPDESWVTGQEAIRALISDRTQYRDRSDGTSEVEYQSPDGRSAYLWDNCIERGEWWVTESEVCFFYPDSALQGPHCFNLKYNDRQELEFWWSGDPYAPLPTATTVKDVPGNAEYLPLGVTGECLMS